jgi:hypothetical protein
MGWDVRVKPSTRLSYDHPDFEETTLVRKWLDNIGLQMSNSSLHRISLQ